MNSSTQPKTRIVSDDLYNFLQDFVSLLEKYPNIDIDCDEHFGFSYTDTKTGDVVNDWEDEKLERA